MKTLKPAAFLRWLQSQTLPCVMAHLKTTDPLTWLLWVSAVQTWSGLSSTKRHMTVWSSLLQDSDYWCRTWIALVSLIPQPALLSIMLCCEFHCGWSGLLTIIKCSVSRAWVGVAEEDAGIAWDGGRWSAVATPKGRRRQKKQQLSPCKTKACREDMVSWYDDDKRMTA